MRTSRPISGEELVQSVAMAAVSLMNFLLPMQHANQTGTEG